LVLGARIAFPYQYTLLEQSSSASI
jgi:hypothetical protein